jgi:glycosyltransferase involved in cell wall biosynthesis
MPKVSVLIPFFNSEAFIEASIASVAAQSHHDVEVILVDDGSVDGSLNIAKRALDKYSLSGSVFQRPSSSKKGAGSCRNLAAAKASGEYLAFLDSDDVWLPQHLERAVNNFAMHGRNMGVYCALGKFFDGDGPQRVIPSEGFPVSGLVNALPVFLGGMSISNVSVCVRKDDFKKTSGFNENLRCYEDWWLMLQLAKSTKFYFNSEVDVLVRERHNSLSREGKADRKPTMSSAMYRDQLRLYAFLGRARFLSQTELAQLRQMIVGWNTRQLTDLACSRQFSEVRRVLSALAEAGINSAPMISRIAVTTLSTVGKRAISKALRSSKGQKPAPLPI